MKQSSMVLLCLLTAWVLVEATASATTFTTTPGSSVINIEVWLGPPSDESTPIAVIPSLGINGLLEATVGIDVHGDGTVSFGGSSLIVDNVLDFPIDFGSLGQLFVDMNAVGIDFSSSGIPLENNFWDVDAHPPVDYFDITLDQGTILLHDAVGVISAYIHTPANFNLTAHPFGVGLDGLIGNGIAGSATADAIHISIPGLPLDMGDYGYQQPGTLFLNLVADINLVRVPEPSSAVSASLGLAGLAVVTIKRMRRRRRCART